MVHIGSIPNNFNNLVNLNEVWLNQNRFTGTFVLEYHCSLLKCYYSHYAIGTVPTVLFSLSTLITLDLSNNSFGGNIVIN